MTRRSKSGDLDRPVMKDHQLPGAQAQGSVDVPIVIAELDLENIWSEVLYHRANLPLVQTLVRKFLDQCHNVEYVYTGVHV
jgi:hypothetical protein